jgi:hypothetical protein
MFGDVILQNLLPSYIDRKIIRCYAMKVYFSIMRSDIGCDMLMSKFYIENMSYYEKIHNGSF